MEQRRNYSIIDMAVSCKWYAVNIKEQGKKENEKGKPLIVYYPIL